MFSFESEAEEADYFRREVVEEDDLARVVQVWIDYLELQDQPVEDRVILHRDGRLEFPSSEQERHEEDLLNSSHARYRHRLLRFRDRVAPFPTLRHAGWWWLHNCVAHMAIGLIPCATTFRLHDWTSQRLNLLGPTAADYHGAREPQPYALRPLPGGDRAPPARGPQPEDPRGPRRRDL